MRVAWARVLPTRIPRTNRLESAGVDTLPRTPRPCGYEGLGEVLGRGGRVDHVAVHEGQRMSMPRRKDRVRESERLGEETLERGFYDVRSLLGQSDRR